jgi:hypothetical protein
MPTGAFEYRDEAERVAIEQAIAFVTPLRDLAVTAPHGRVIDQLEGHALDAGRELLRTSLERAAQASVDAGEGKKGRTASARAGAGGTASGGSSGPW